MKFQKHWKLLTIVIVALFSVGQILRLYFSYEDFSLLYGLQFPNDQYSIFKVTGVVAYLFSQPLLTPQYFLFTYNPLGYYFVSLLLFLAALFFFYRFFRIFYPQNEELAFFATAVMASGYVGVESLTWNVGGGQLHLALLIAAFFALTRVVIFFSPQKKQKTKVGFLRIKRFLEFTSMVVSLAFAIYFFQFRSYLLLVWVPFAILSKRLADQGHLSKQLVILIAFLLIGLSLLFSQSIDLVLGRIAHLNVDIPALLDVYLKNLTNLFFPSDLIATMKGFSGKYERALGIFVFLGVVMLPAYLILRRRPFAWVAFFFSSAIIFSLTIIMVVIAFVGQVPVVWSSSHRFYIVLLPFVSGYLAILISLLRPILKWPALMFIVAVHIWFSNYAIFSRWDSLSRHLKYFYTGVTKAVRNPENNSAFLITLSRPMPPGPFVSGSHTGSGHYLAGFYHRRFGDFYLATDSLEAVKLLLDKNISVDKLYTFDYKREDIADETLKAREIFGSGRITSLGQNVQGREIEFTNLGISFATPVFVKARIQTALAQPPTPTLLLNDGTMSIDKHFQLFFEQEEKRRVMMIDSSPAMGEEHRTGNIIDGRYETTWIPQSWGSDGVNVTINLGAPRKVYQVVWSSSRTAPWQFRSPSAYEIAVSKDGVKFTNVANVDSASLLTTGQFFTVDTGGQEFQYLRLVIKKTHGGWTPAVDEIEFFEKQMNQKDLENYFLVKNKPQEYFPNQEFMLRYYKEILNKKIPIEVNWKVDWDGGYPAGQEKKMYVEGLGSFKNYMVLLPKTGRVIKSVRIRSVDFPSTVVIKSLEVWQPSLEEFRANQELLKVE